jgi:ornithine decarboxylase
MTPATLLKLAKKHGTPLFVVDHDELRKNYRLFRKHFPRIQIYYAVKVNSDPAIVETFYELGGSFDVASMQEFHTVHQFIKHLPAKERQDFIWDKVIYANPIKPVETLHELDRYKPLVTYDNHEEVKKIAKHAPHAGLALQAARAEHRLDGRAVEQVRGAAGRGGGADRARPRPRPRGRGTLVSHVGSQCTNPQNFIQAIHLCAPACSPRRSPAASTSSCSTSAAASRPPMTSQRAGVQRARVEVDQSRARPALPQASVEILAEPGRFLVASAGNGRLKDHRQGVPQREDSATTSTTASITPTRA